MQLHGRAGHPDQHLARGVVAEGLLHPVGDPGGVGEGFDTLVGVAPTPVPGIAQQLGGGLVAGHHHEEEEGDDLVVGQLVAVDLGRQQGRGQVVPAGPGGGWSTMAW